MAIKLMDMIETAGDFPVIDAPSVGIPGGGRLDAVFDEGGKIKSEMLPQQTTLETILPEQTVEGFTYNDEFAGSVVQISQMFTLTAGETYSVHWDGGTHSCVAQDLSEGTGETVGLGALESVGGTGNGEPFMVVVVSSQEAVVLLSTDTEAAAHTVGIFREVSGARDPRLDALLEASPGELLVGRSVSGFALDEAYGYCSMLSASAPLAAGETYLVSWDGNDHTVTAFNANVEAFGDLVAVGNGSAFSPEYPESDAPFIIAATGSSTLILAFDDPAESHDIYIYPMVDKVKESYLPESWVKNYVEAYIDEALRGDY